MSVIIAETSSENLQRRVKDFYEFLKESMNESQTNTYEFEEFRIDGSKRLLIKENDEIIPLTPKVFDLLFYLVQNSGRVIEKDELMTAIWTDTIVEESNLSQNISILRRVLGEKRGEHRFIATIPGHGYKFVADVSEISQPFAMKPAIGNERSLTTLDEYSEFNSLSFDSFKSAPANNFLSNNLLPIIGRKSELTEIEGLLGQSDIRLITITGVGGSGKTRLAQAIMEKSISKFIEGTYFIDLSTIDNPDLVIPVIGQTLGIYEIRGKSLKDNLVNFLREKNMLIVLDNFEQITEAASCISELLAGSLNLKILITSRVRLNLRFEHEFVLLPLKIPDHKKLTLEELSAYSAIELFVKSVKRVKRSFDLTEENAESIAEICRRFDGLPLAIELAAARLKLLTPQSLLLRLKNSLKLLTGGAKDLPERQQTMSRAIGWSYDLLTEDEKRLFRRLSVFAGGLIFEAAEAICVSYESDKKEIEFLELITSLVEKSLVVSKEQPDGDLRFRLLEVVREFALESLEMSGEMEAMRRSHAEYFLMLGEEAETHLQTAEAREWLNRLEVEHDNLRTAIRWLFKKDAERAARLVAAIRIYLINHCHLTEGREWLTTALEQGAELPATVRFKLLNALGYLAFYQGDYETAQKMFEEDLAEGQAAGDKPRIAESLRGLGAVAHSQDDYTAARKFGEEGLAIHRGLNDIFGIAKSLNGLGALALDEGDSATAGMLLEESLTNFRLVGNESGICYCLFNLGEIAYFNSDYGAARKHYAEVLNIAQNLGYKDRISFCLDRFAALAGKRGEWKIAIKLISKAEHLRKQIDFDQEHAYRSPRYAYLAELKTEMDEADFPELYEQGRKLKLEEAIALCLEETGGEAKTEISKAHISAEKT